MLKIAWKDKKPPPNFDLSALAGIEKVCDKQLRSLLDKLTRSTKWLQMYWLGNPALLVFLPGADERML